ncbi:c-type cytochrome [Roseiconus nitratireducens]|uniref:C-type cytochrome n=1 Tax=Roseiconus nitratireducens TaxID=2605748 RepID=A0A5M6DLV9_9BACT|nr:neutral/alkaline non-lysosomal ceramidase N-terminal domain-containing protein [Roseiconus nitratireducens]KAA5547209.1 c-type cytochrome [Roseiconus nitratireducens]
MMHKRPTADRRRRFPAFPVLFLLLVVSPGVAEEPLPAWKAGFAKVDITPTEPVRMSGYGSRDHVNEGVDMPLMVRSMALQATSPDASPLVLVSVDTIGLPGALTQEIAATLKDRNGLNREQIVFCSTHTHCAPTLDANLSNIFTVPLTPAEAAAADRYRNQLREAILKAVAESLANQSPAELSYDVGKAAVAANRRVLVDGRWTGFGIQRDGPVDHSVPTLRINAPDGKLRGIVFNYACHCTSLGGDHYRINGDWAGYATEQLEREHPGAVALCTIGCGADANPVTRGNLEDAVMHGKTLADEVTRVTTLPMQPVRSAPVAHFDYAALPFDLPTEEELRERLEDPRPQMQRHAKKLLETYQSKGRLPATYPVPVQTWQFGDELTMIFMGGEVVVDYALRLKKLVDDPQLWVTAYANDVLGYIVSERMRPEGGYEYDYSGVFYGLPGPWASGSEDKLIGQIQRLLESTENRSPVSADQSLHKLRVADPYRVELVAAEPLVADPINFAFDGEGRLWVVEMGDYPEGEQGGRVKVLHDTDQDGRFDTAETFLSELSFPTGVQPWGDGALITAAPDILLARDTDGDGKADDVQTLYSGFRLANPQHRISGFAFGLDGALHLAAGDNLSEITSERTGEVLDASGHDLKIWPDDGRMQTTSGRTQYLRSRDDWGHWFGSDNSRPGYHYPIEDRYLQRNPSVRFPSNNQPLFQPAVAPPVFPITRATERFNDLYAANRFTSACSSHVARTPMFRSGGHDSLMVCEPVHNLVHRSMLVPDGSTYRAERLASESQSEFLASSDPWFRPVCAKIGPDGALWIADMYRAVIEHPEWIPDAWQQQVDLRAGADRGRIYRISSPQTAAYQSPGIKDASIDALIAMLRSPIGPRRDLAHRRLLELSAASVSEALKRLDLDQESPATVAHVISLLATHRSLEPDTLCAALQRGHAGLQCVALRLSESQLDNRLVLESVCRLAHQKDPAVLLQTALTLGESQSDRAGAALAAIAARPDLDSWMARAVASSAQPHAEVIAANLLQTLRESESVPAETTMQLFSDLLLTAGSSSDQLADSLRKTLEDDRLPKETRWLIAASAMQAQRTTKQNESELRKAIEQLYRDAIQTAADQDRSATLRVKAMALVGLGIAPRAEERSWLLTLISPAVPPAVQSAAMDHLSQAGDVEVADALIDRWPSLSQSLRQQCVWQLLSRSKLHQQLLDAIESGRIGLNDLSPAAKQQLLQSGSRSMKVRAARLVHTYSSPDKGRLIGRYLEQDPGPGTAPAEEGPALFKQHCGTCHLPGESGAAVGASLENLSDPSDASLMTSILDPNRSMEPKYQTYLVQTVDGRSFVGTIESEAGESLTLAHADGKRTVLNRSEIEAMKNTGVSLMPEGFENTLSPSQVHAIIDYLQTATTRAN